MAECLRLCKWCGMASTEAFCRKACKSAFYRKPARPWHSHCGFCNRELPTVRYPSTKFCSSKCASADARKRIEADPERLADVRAKRAAYMQTEEFKSANREAGKRWREANPERYVELYQSANKKQADTRPLVVAECPTCSTVFQTRNSRKKYCCKRCLAEASLVRYDNARLRLELPKVGVVQNITAYLIERDRGRCHICGKKVDPKADRRSHPKGATIDHLIPFSISHDSSLENLALAHGRCNKVKHVGAANDQLRLVG